MKAVLSFETFGSNYPTTRRNNLENFFQLTKSFSPVSFPLGDAASFPHDLSRIFR
jgi:hypothetical protein